MSTATLPPSLASVGSVVGITGTIAVYFVSGAPTLVLVLIGFLFGDLMNIEHQNKVENASEQTPSSTAQV